MKNKLKSFSVLIIVIFIMTMVFTGVINYVQAAITGALIDATSTRAYGTVETTTITFTADTAINTNDGIQITFANNFDISAVVNADVAVTQTNSGVDITKGTAVVSGQNLQIPITTEGDTPAGEVTITISNSNIINPAPGLYVHTIKTYDLGADNAFGGSGGDADVQEETKAYVFIVGANVAILQDATSAIESGASTAVATTSIIFDPVTDINLNDGIQINFASGFNIASVVNADVTLYQDNYTTSIAKGIAAVSGQNLQIPITTEGLVPAGSVLITIENSNITTPVAGTYKITATTWDLGADNAFGGAGANADTLEDTYSMAVVIGDTGVTISAEIDPTISLDVVQKSSDTAATTCALGAFTTDNINTCVYRTKVVTNSDNGYTAYLRSDGNLTHTNASDTIASEGGDNSITEGSEEYGIATTTASMNISRIDDTTTTGDVLGTPDGNYDYWDCDYTNSGNDVTATFSALTTSDQSIGSLTTPTSGDYTTICHGASISGTTTAGSYSQTVTVTVVGNF